MSGLVRVGLDRFRRLNEIERIGLSHRPKGERERHYVKMRDGETFDLSEHERDALLRRPVQLTPAEPGCSIIRVSDDAEKPWTYREPVIAWALCLDGEVRPVSPNGITDDSSESSYVEMPGGRIEGIGEWSDLMSFESVEKMAAHFAAAKTEALDG